MNSKNSLRFPVSLGEVKKFSELLDQNPHKSKLIEILGTSSDYWDSLFYKDNDSNEEKARKMGHLMAEYFLFLQSLRKYEISFLKKSGRKLLSILLTLVKVDIIAPKEIYPTWREGQRDILDSVFKKRERNLEVVHLFISSMHKAEQALEEPARKIISDFEQYLNGKTDDWILHSHEGGQSEKIFRNGFEEVLNLEKLKERNFPDDLIELVKEYVKS